MGLAHVGHVENWLVDLFVANLLEPDVLVNRTVNISLLNWLRNAIRDIQLHS